MSQEVQKRQTVGEWLGGFLSPQVIIVVFALVGGFTVSVQLHHANTDLHHTTQWLDSRYVQCAVHAEEQKRLDEQLARTDKALDRVEQLLRESTSAVKHT